MNNKVNSRYNYTLSFWESITVPIIIILIGQIIGSIIGLGANYFGLLSVGMVASFGISFGCSAALLFLYKKLSFSVWKEMILSKTKFIYWVLSIALFVSILPLGEYATTLVPTKGIDILEKLYEVFLESFKMIFDHPIAAFITVCILAPILEETIFRGFILQGLLNNKMNPCLAIIFTSLFFGLAHLNPWQFIGASILGACFGFIYWRTGSLLICIFLHFLNNTISYIVTMKTNDLESTYFEMNYLLLIGSIFLTIFFTYQFYKITEDVNIRYTK